MKIVLLLKVANAVSLNAMMEKISCINRYLYSQRTPANLIFLILVLAYSSVYNSPAIGQTMDSTKYRIETVDGNSFYGRLTGRDSVYVYLDALYYGEMKVKHSHVRTIKAIQKEIDEEMGYWPDDPQATRYFWAPNGYGLKNKEGYYQNIWVLWNQFAVGVTDKFSMGGGMIPLFLFAGAPTPIWITPKFSFPIVKNKVNLGVGTLAGTIVGEQSDFAIIYGIVTFGSRDKNLSVGYGNGLWRNRNAYQYDPNTGNSWTGTEINNINMIDFNFMVRTGPKGYLLSENMMIVSPNQNFGLFSIGGRRIIRSLGLDFGLFIPVENNIEFIAIPWLGLTLPFN